MRVSEFAERIGRSASTVRRWESEGRIAPQRTATGQRFFTEEDVRAALNMPREQRASTVVYTRVSSSSQKDDLKSQRMAMETFCLGAGIAVDEWVSDIGSGLNFQRKGLLSLMDRAADGEQITLLVAHKDRLARFGFDLIEHQIVRAGGKIVVVNHESLSPEAELVADILSILHVFSSRLYGLRRYEKAIRKDLA